LIFSISLAFSRNFQKPTWPDSTHSKIGMGGAGDPLGRAYIRTDAAAFNTKTQRGQDAKPAGQMITKYFGIFAPSHLGVFALKAF